MNEKGTIDLNQKFLKNQTLKTIIAVGLTIVLITFVILFYTAYPSIGWWDSGNYAADAKNMGIPGPGGSILFVLLGRFLNIVFFFIPTIKAVTMVSIISTSLASIFLYYALLNILQNFQDYTDESAKIAVSFLTALSLPFLYSIWVESYVTRVYTLGLLLTSVVFLCTVKIWFSENEKQKLKLFLLIIFLMGIDFAAHRLNSPFLPVILILLIFPLRKHLLDYKFWISIIIVYLLSLSLHFYLIIRGQLYPPLDTGNVHSFSNLISWIRMEIWGSESNFLLLFNRRAPLWDYQINFMYIRYFGWNFWGKEGLTIFSIIPFVLGCIGFVFSIVKKFKAWLIIFLSYVFFSIILVLYLNVTEGFNNIREIDRLFIPSFFIFLCWVGVGLYFLFYLIRKFISNKILTKRVAFVSLFAAGLIILPLNLIFSNQENCNKNRYYFPEDFAYNLLSSCEKNAVIFVNGDNDTFPLWYLQSVEGYRTDITVANLSLLNTRFYIDQLLTGENPVPFDSTITGSEQLTPSRIDSTIDIKIAPPKFPVSKLLTQDSLTVSFSGHNFGGNKLFLIQDKALISFLKENKWRRPVYFSLTVAQENMLGLNDYLSLIGIANKLLPVKDTNILPQRLEENLLQNYRFRSFNNPDVKLHESYSFLFNNFRHAFLRLAEHYFEKGDKEKAKGIIDIMDKKLPKWRFPDQLNQFIVDFENKIK